MCNLIKMLCGPRLFILSLALSSVSSVLESSQGFVALEVNGRKTIILEQYQLLDRAR
jgi:hypothetical protein